MAEKKILSKEELELLFDSKFSTETWEFFDKWLEGEIEEENIKLIEPDRYDVSKIISEADGKVGQDGRHRF